MPLAPRGVIFFPLGHVRFLATREGAEAWRPSGVTERRAGLAVSRGAIQSGTGLTPAQGLQGENFHNNVW